MAHGLPPRLAGDGGGDARAAGPVALTSPAREATPVDLVVGFIVVTSGVMLWQLVRGTFDVATALFASLIFCGGIALATVRRVALPMSARQFAAAGLIALVALAFRWSPFLYVDGGQDQGVYVAMSSHFARTHGAAITDPVRSRLSESEKAEYDRLNQRHERTTAQVPGRFEGEHQPGVYIADLSRSSYVFQFYPLHPLWMALAAGVFGEDNRVYSLVVFSLLGVLMLALIAYEVAGREAAPAYIAALLLAANPISVFLSRFPLTENVALFFAASALYYLLRYARDARAAYLLLSAGAWGCLFFTHIGGFLYAPVIIVAVLALVVSAARTAEVAAYGLAVLVLYALSFWYGVTWSYPYTYETFVNLFGARGPFLVAHGGGMLVIVALLYGASVYAARRYRDRIRDAWFKASARRIATLALLAIVAVSLAWSLFDAYRLAYTTHYWPPAEPGEAASALLGANALLFALSNSGTTGLLHTSLAALTLYVSPFLLAFVLAVAVVRRRDLDDYALLALFVVTLFFFLRTVLVSVALYYYYGRYVGGDLAPYLIVLAAVLAWRMWQQSALRGKAIAGAVIASTLAWEGLALAQQYPGGELHRLDASLRPLARVVGSGDLILIAGDPYPPLRTSLDYYYGRPTVVVAPGNLDAAVQRHASQFGDVYVLSQNDNLRQYGYAGAFTLTYDGYAKGTPLDVLPRNSKAVERRFYLFRVNRPLATALRSGDALTFDERGSGRNYLAGGWSYQEAWGRWSEGDLATLELPIADRGVPLVLRFEVQARNCVPVTVLVNGRARTNWTFSDCNQYAPQAIELTPDDTRTGSVTIALQMENVKSPQETDPKSGDRRKLGLSIRRMAVDPRRS
jgi:4-amino-4-deoxy-L-arabinose transferase-like glycosyltransferase